MTSSESGQSRAAILMDAARRSHFVAKIHKYEAKVKQEQKRRALQREKQMICMTLIEQHPTSWQSPESPLLPKVHVRMEEYVTSPSNQHEKDGILGSSFDTDHKDIEGARRAYTTNRALGSDSGPDTRVSNQGSSSILLNSPKGTRKGGAMASIVSGLAPTETKPTHSDLFITLKPSAALDVNIISIAAALEVKIKKADMAVVMQEHAFQCAKQCLKTTEKLMSKHTAYTLKKEFDRAYGPAWHCIVGRSFGSYVTHSVGGFVYFTLEKVSVLLFKTTVELVEH